MVGDIQKYILIFFIYSFLGWCMETFGGYFKVHKLINRGFLIGPYCPVYGIGVVLITFFLSKYVNDLPVMFIMSIVICGTLEYFTSYIMEKVFKARWWDYHNRKFNINGRICLETLIPFGLVGTIIVKFISPFFLNKIFKIPVFILDKILIILCLIFVIDVIVSLKVILSFRKTAKETQYEIKDNTEEISKKVKEITTEKVMEIKKTAVDKINDMATDFKASNRKLIVNVKILNRNVKYTGKKIYAYFKETTDKFRKNIEVSNEKIRKNIVGSCNAIKENIDDSHKKLKRNLEDTHEKMKKNIENSQIKFKESIKNSKVIFRKNTYEDDKDLTENVKTKFFQKSWLTRRLTKAFPNLEVKIKDKK